MMLTYLYTTLATQKCQIELLRVYSALKDIFSSSLASLGKKFHSYIILTKYQRKYKVTLNAASLFLVSYLILNRKPIMFSIGNQIFGQNIWILCFPIILQKKNRSLLFIITPMNKSSHHKPSGARC